jgi:integrase/recombinase XerD
MGKLKDQMVMDMELRNFSDKTIKAYLGHMVSYTKKFGKSPADLGDDEVRQYLHYL